MNKMTTDLYYGIIPQKEADIHSLANFYGFDAHYVVKNLSHSQYMDHVVFRTEDYSQIRNWFHPHLRDMWAVARNVIWDHPQSGQRTSRIIYSVGSSRTQTVYMRIDEFNGIGIAYRENPERQGRLQISHYEASTSSVISPGRLVLSREIKEPYSRHRHPLEVADEYCTQALEWLGWKDQDDSWN